MRTGAIALVLILLGGCSRASRPSFPPPARPPVFMQADFETAYSTLLSTMEARGYPLVVEDPQFGSVRTDWVYFEPEEILPLGLAECPAGGQGEGRMRARFGFDVRRRTVQTTVTLLSQWQKERLAGFDGSDRGFVDCRSTGEWERALEGVLTHRGTIR